MRAAGSTALVTPRTVVAALPFVAAPGIYLLTAISTRLPARLLVPLAIVTWWLNLGALPIPLFFGTQHMGLVLALVQSAVAVLAFLWVRRRSGGTRWLLREDPTLPAGTSLARVAGFLGAPVVLGPPLLAAYAVLALATWIGAATEGFVSFHLRGISLADRHYERGPEEVRLVGMMHLGEAESYDALFDSFAVPGTVVLEEGVTDHEGRLENLLSYERVARGLGLEAQEPLELHFEEAWEEADDEERWPELRHADVDASEFHAETIAFLEEAAALWAAEDLPQALRRLLDLMRKEQVDLERVQEDILIRRNRHLFAELERALEEHDRVVVPWGALHLPWIESELLRTGFERRHASERPLIWWGPGPRPSG